MIRAFWSTYAAVLAAWTAILIATLAGPAIESRVAPVRADQHVGDVVRHDGRLCWTWSSDKLRALASTSIDVLIDVPGDVIFGSVFREEDGQPWHLLGTVGVGRREPRLCVLIPPHVTAADPIRVRVAIHYPGWRGLWDLRSVMPDVVSPAG